MSLVTISFLSIVFTICGAMEDITPETPPCTRTLFIPHEQYKEYQNQYHEWIKDNTTESYNSITHHFRFMILEKDALLPWPTLLDRVLDACYALDTIETDLFAHTAWKFITKHCLVQPY
eukprot:755665_1